MGEGGAEHILEVITGAASKALPSSKPSLPCISEGLGERAD